MNITFHSFSFQAVSFGREQLLTSLTSEQKKILAVLALAMSALALCYTLHRFCFKAQPLASPSPVRLVPPFIWNRVKISPSDSDIPPGYEWVKGNANAKTFMETTTDLSIVAAVAKSAECRGSPLRAPNSFLLIGSLVDYASLEQIQAMVKAVADNRFQVRAIFSNLFYQMKYDVAHIDSWKQKAQVALQALSRDQLMDILAIKMKNEYVFMREEIWSIPLKGFMQWKDDLNLPQEFIEGCEALLEYAKRIEPEIEKGPLVEFD